jgi:hypothetical protein
VRSSAARISRRRWPLARPNPLATSTGTPRIGPPQPRSPGHPYSGLPTITDRLRRPRRRNPTSAPPIPPRRPWSQLPGVVRLLPSPFSLPLSLRASAFPCRRYPEPPPSWRPPTRALISRPKPLDEFPAVQPLSPARSRPPRTPGAPMLANSGEAPPRGRSPASNRRPRGPRSLWPSDLVFTDKIRS